MGFTDFFKKRPKHDEFDGLIINAEEQKQPRPEVKKVEPETPKPIQEPVQKIDNSSGSKVKSVGTGEPFFKETPTWRKAPYDYQADDGFAFNPQDNFGKADNPYRRAVFERPIRYEMRPLIVVAVENSSEVCKYYTDITSLLKKIVSDNKDSFFLFLRMGTDQKYFDILHHDKLKENNLPEGIISDKVEHDLFVKLADALAHIYENIKTKPLAPLRFKHDEKDYEISSSKIIVIGSGKIDTISSDQKQSCEFVKSICETTSVKAFKYFCLKDSNAINAAKIGFPEIGHIDYTFYD